METDPVSKISENEEYVVFKSNFDHSVIGSSKMKEIKDMLPYWKTEIQTVQMLKNSNMLLKFSIAATTVEEIKDWIHAYEILTNAIYSIKSTERSSGKYVNFKQRLYCRHNTGCSRIYEAEKKNRTRNTNCAAAINITLRVVNKVYRGKDPKKAPNPDMPCEIVLQPNHNHETLYSDAFRFQVVPEETREQLIKLFEEGHTPVTALKLLKSNIQMTSESCEQMLTNRKCYDFCRYLYKKEFMKKNLPIDISKRVTAYNEELGEDSVQIIFKDSEYVLCICTPMLRRIHKFIPCASEAVFLDSSGPPNQDGTMVYSLMVQSACGALPLAYLILTCESLLGAGFHLLKSMLGDDIFGGKPDGPTTFIIDDSGTQQDAIQSEFKNSCILLCTFHVLQNLWIWLMTTENDINREDQVKLYTEFRDIMHARSSTECETKYKEALKDALKYPKYTKFLEDYFTRKELWVLSYREAFFSQWHQLNHNCESSMLLLKDKMFQKTKGYNIIQRLNFIMTKWLPLYEKLLLDTSYNRARRSMLHYEVKYPSQEIMLKMQTLADLIYLVPSESVDFLFYIVNTEVLLCTCSESRSGKICKHIHWAYSLEHCEPNVQKVSDEYDRKMFHYVATGSEPVENWSYPVIIKSIDDGEEFNEESISMEPAYCIEEVETCNSEDFVREENRTIIEDIGQTLLTLSETSPLEVGAALNTMKENLKKVTSASALSTLCTTLAAEVQTPERMVQHVLSKKRSSNSEVNNIVSTPKKRIVILRKVHS